MAKQTQHHGRAWYVIHTYSGYEDNVARNLKQRIESMDMQDLIFDVMVPIEKKIKINMVILMTRLSIFISLIRVFIFCHLQVDRFDDRLVFDPDE